MSQNVLHKQEQSQSPYLSFKSRITWLPLKAIAFIFYLSNLPLLALPPVVANCWNQCVWKEPYLQKSEFVWNSESLAEGKILQLALAKTQALQPLPRRATISAYIILIVSSKGPIVFWHCLPPIPHSFAPFPQPFEATPQPDGVRHASQRFMATLIPHHAPS